jgi:phosphatidyl-myo-inositol alpha-mannosyltransferase
MKIALVSPYDFEHPGGVVNHIQSLAEEFARLGHTVKIIAPVTRHKLKESEQFIPIGRPAPIPSSGSVSRISLSLHLAPRIKEVLRQERFDVIHLHEPFVPMLCSAMLRFSDGVNIGTFHAFASRPGYAVGWPFTTYLLHRRNRKLKGRIAVSLPAQRYASKHVSGDFSIIPNGVDLRRFAPEVEPITQYKDGKLNILFVGRIEPRKGLVYLIKAYKKIKSDYPDTRLLVVGPGLWFRRKYELQVKLAGIKDVVFTGRVSYKELPRYYATADIFCAPATGRESFGIILLEAMAMGKPIIASRIEGYASVITHKREGLLVPPKDPASLAHALELCIKNRILRQGMGDQGLVTVRQYDWPIIARRVLEYYEKIIDWSQPKFSRPSRKVSLPL